MAVSLFTLTVTTGSSSSTYYYKTEGGSYAWYDSNGTKQESFTAASVPTSADDDGYYTVTVNKAIFGSGTPAIGYSVTLTDANPDRKSFKLALGSDLETYKYGSGQSALAKYNEDIETTILSISNISAGLFVETGGKKISWETDTSDKEISVDGIAKNSDEDLKKTIWVDGKNIIVGANALSGTTSLNFTGGEGYYFSLSGVSISQYTEEGWNFTSGGTSAAYYSASSTTGWQVTNRTNISYNNTARGGSSLFNVSGLTGVNDQSELVEYFNIDSATNRNVALTQAGVSLLIDGHSLTNGASTAITLKDTDSNDGVNYGLALGALSDFDHSGYASAAFTTVTSVSSTYNYSSSHHGIYGSAATNYGHSSTLAIYADKPLYTFSLSGLATGLISSSGVVAGLSYTYTDNTGLLDVTLSQSAVAGQNIFGTALSDFGSVIFRNGGISVPEGGNSAQLLSLGSGSFTFQAQGNSGGTYTNFNTNTVYFHKTSFGGQSIIITGLSSGYTSGTFDSNGILWGKIGDASTSIATIKPVTDGEGNTTFDIAFNDFAFSSIGGNIGVSSAGGSFTYNLSLTDLNRADYAEQKDYTFQINNSAPSATAKSLSAIGGGSYRFIDSYVPAYFSTATTNNSLAAGSGVIYTYIGAASHIDFSITGLSKADNLFNTATTTTGGYSSVFTIGVPSTTGGVSTYTITLKSDVVNLLNGSDSKAELRIVDNDDTNKISYLLSNPSPIKAISAALNAVSGITGAFVYNTGYSTAGWSALGGNNSASTAFQFYGQANGVPNAFTLTGLMGIGSDSTFTVTAGGTSNIITFLNGSETVTLGTVSESTGIFTINAAGFSKAAGITSGTSTASITLTDTNAGDKWYHFELGGGMSTYGASNMRATVFDGNGTYNYKSGGLSAGYSFTYTDSEGNSASYAGLAGLSTGATTLTWYAEAASHSFAISGLAANISASAVLDYFEITSYEDLKAYVIDTTKTDWTLKSGYYHVTGGGFSVANRLFVGNGSKVVFDVDEGATVACNIDIQSIFDVNAGGELILQGGGSLIHQRSNSTGDLGYIVVMGRLSSGQNTSSAPAAKLTVNGNLYLEASNAAISGNNTWGKSEITINGGTIVGNNKVSSNHSTEILNDPSKASVGIYSPEKGTLIINGGEIKGDTGISVRSGTLIVNGGTISGLSTFYSYSKNTSATNGSTTTGAGINISPYGTTSSEPITLTILGGEISGYTALSIINPEPVSGTNYTPTVNVLGGTLTSTSNYTGNFAASTHTINSNTITATAISGAFAVFNADERVKVNIGNVSLAKGGISGYGYYSGPSAGEFAIFADYDGNSLAKFNGNSASAAGGYSNWFVYSNYSASVLGGISYVPSLASSAAVVVGASGGYITLNAAALSAGSTVKLTNKGDYAGLSLGSDVNVWGNSDTRWSGGRPYDKSVKEGWTITGVSMAGDSSVDSATWLGRSYLESWALSGTDTVNYYAAAGGASIGLTGLSAIVANGYNAISGLTQNQFEKFFSISQIGGTEMTTAGVSITRYDLTVNAGNSLFWALDEGEKLTFTFDKGKDSSASLSLAFGSDITGYRTALNGASSDITGFSHSATIVGSGTSFTFTEAGTSSYYSLSAITGGAELEHVAQKGLTNFSLSGLSAFAGGFSFVTTDGVTKLYGLIGSSSIEIGSISYATLDTPRGEDGIAGASIGYVTLTEKAFNAKTYGGVSRIITLTDLNMRDGVDYRLVQIGASTAETINQSFTGVSSTMGGGSLFTFTLGGTSAYWTLTSMSAKDPTATYPGGTSGSYLQYIPQVGGQGFTIDGLSSFTFTANGSMSQGINIVVGDVSYASISFTGGASATAAVVTLLDPTILGNLTNGASASFAFKDNEDDNINYSFALSSAFNVKDSVPTASAAFTTATGGGYSYYAPYEDAWTKQISNTSGSTVAGGSATYTYTAAKNPHFFTITGLSTGFAASDAYSISGATAPLTTIQNSAASSLFSVATVGASGLSVIVFANALSAVRQDITINMGGGSLFSFTFDGTLGQSGVSTGTAAFGSTSSGAFTYQAETYSEYYTEPTIGASGVTNATASYYAGTGGELFKFSGISAGDFSAGISTAMTVNVSDSMVSGQYRVQNYSFSVTRADFLYKLGVGESLAVAKSSGQSYSTFSLGLSSGLGVSTLVNGVLSSSKVVNQSGVSYYATLGVSNSVLTYTAKLNSHDWFKVGTSTITHIAQSGGQQFTLAGLTSSITSGITTGTISLAGDGDILTTSGGTSFAKVEFKGASAYVYLTEAAFGGVSGSTITLTDLNDSETIRGASTLTYGLSYAAYVDANTTQVYLPQFGASHSDAALVESTSQSGLYNFTAYGQRAGISLSDNVATFYQKVGSEQFSLSGLQFGMAGISYVYNVDGSKNDVTMTYGGTSVVNVVKSANGNQFTFSIYAGALSTVAADRHDIILSSTDSTYTGNYILYVKTLGESFALTGNKPYVEKSSGTSIAFTSGSAAWTSTLYHDYYVRDENTYHTAKHHDAVGGHSFTFTVAKDNNTKQASFSNLSLSVTEDTSFDETNRNFSVTKYTFGVGNEFLKGMSAGYTLSVAKGDTTANYPIFAFSYAGPTVTKYADLASNSSAILVSVDSAEASVGAQSGTLNFAASISNYDYFAMGASSLSIKHIGQQGGQSFKIEGLADSLGTLTYSGDSSVGYIMSGSNSIGKIVFTNTLQSDGDVDKIAYVYLTEAAIGSISGASTKITLTDLKDNDGIAYSLSIAATGDATYLVQSASALLPNFTDLGGGSYLYTGGIVQAGVSGFSLSTTGGLSTSFFTYYKQSGGESFTISGLTAGLGLSVKDYSGTVYESGGGSVGTIDLSGDSRAFELRSTMLLGSMSAGATRVITLTDYKGDNVNYSLSLAGNFNLQSTSAAPADSTGITRKEDTTGVYKVTGKGTPAYAWASQSGISYIYKNASSSQAYTVTGLVGGMSAGAMSAVFGIGAVSLFTYALPTDKIATIKFTDNSAGASFVVQSGIAGASWTIGQSASITDNSAGASFTAATYQPWYETSSFAPSSSIVVHPEVGGESFALKGFATGLELSAVNGTGGTLFTVGGSSVGVVTAVLGASGLIDSYTFEVSSKDALGSLSQNGDVISVTTSTFGGSYTLDVPSSVIAHSGVWSDGTKNYSANIYTYVSKEQSEYITQTDVHSYSYSAAVGGYKYLGRGGIQNVLLGSGISVAEQWTGTTLSAITFTLGASALPTNPTSTTNIYFTKHSSNTSGASIFMALDNTVTLRSAKAAGFSTVDTITGSYTFSLSGAVPGYYLDSGSTAIKYDTTTRSGASFSITGLATMLGGLSLSGASTVMANGVSVASLVINNGTGVFTITDESALNRINGNVITLYDLVDDDINYSLSMAGSLLSSTSPASVKVASDDLNYTPGQGSSYELKDNFNTTSRTGSYSYIFSGWSYVGGPFKLTGISGDLLDTGSYNATVDTNGLIQAIGRGELGGTSVSIASVDTTGASGVVSLYSTAFEKDGSTITISGMSTYKYSLSLASGLHEYKYTNASFSAVTGTAGKYNFFAGGNSNSYKISNDALSVTYKAATGGYYFSLSGLNTSLADLSVSGTPGADQTVLSGSTNLVTFDIDGNAYNVTLSESAVTMGSTSFNVILSNVGNSYAAGNDGGNSMAMNNVKFYIASASGNTITTKTKYDDDVFNWNANAASATTASGSTTWTRTYQIDPKSYYWATLSSTATDQTGFTFMPSLSAVSLFSVSGLAFNPDTNFDLTVSVVSQGAPSGTFYVQIGDSLLAGLSSTSTAIAVKDEQSDNFNAYLKYDSRFYMGSFSKPDDTAATFIESGSSYVYTNKYVQGHIRATGTSAAITSISYIAKDGAQPFSITGLTSGLSFADGLVMFNGASVGSIVVNGSSGVFTLTDVAALGNVASGSSVQITLIDSDPDDGVNYSLSIEGNFNLGGSGTSGSDTLDITGASSGTYQYQMGAVSAYTRQNVVAAGYSSSFTYYAALSSTNFDFTGLNTGLSAGDTALFGLQGTSFTLQTGALSTGRKAGDQITFNYSGTSVQYTMTLAQSAMTSVVPANFYASSPDQVIGFVSQYDTAGYSSISSANAKTTYEYMDSTKDKVGSFKVTGIKPGLYMEDSPYTIGDDGSIVKSDENSTIGSYSEATHTFTLNNNAMPPNPTATSVVELTSENVNYSLSLGSDVDTTNESKPAYWSNFSGGVSYNSAYTDSYWYATPSATNSFSFNEKDDSKVLFTIGGSALVGSASASLTSVTPSASGVVTFDANASYLLKNEGASVFLTNASGQSYSLFIEGNMGTSIPEAIITSGNIFSLSSYSAGFYGGGTSYVFHEYSAQYQFGLSVGTQSLTSSDFSIDEIDGKISTVEIMKGSSVAAYLDKETNTVYVYSNFVGDQTTSNIYLTNIAGTSVTIAAGASGVFDDKTGSTLKTTGTAAQDGWNNSNGTITYGSANITKYYVLDGSQTLKYIAKSGGDTFKFDGISTTATATDIGNAFTVSIENGTNYVFTLNNDSILSSALSAGGLSVTIQTVGNNTKNAGINLTAALAISSALGLSSQESAQNVASFAGSLSLFTAAGISAFYTSETLAAGGSYGEGFIASLSYHKPQGFESFTIATLSNAASLSGTAIVNASNSTLAYIDNSTLTNYGSHSGAVNVYLTAEAFGGVSGKAITLTDKAGDGVIYGLSYGSSNYLGQYKVNGYDTNASFSSTNGVYNYSASVRYAGISIDGNAGNGASTTATFGASVGINETFGISGLTSGLTAEFNANGFDLKSGSTTVGGLSGATFTLTNVAAIGEVERGASKAIILTDDVGGQSYTLAIDSSFAPSSVSTIAAALENYATGGTSAYTYTEAHNAAYVQQNTAGVSYTYFAEAVAAGFSITGLAKDLSSSALNDSFTVSNYVVTLGQSALAESNVSFIGSNSYTLALYNVAGASYHDADFSAVVGTSATYYDAWNTAGYSVAGNSKSIGYTAAVGQSALFALSGIASTSGIAVGTNLVTLGQSALNEMNVTLTDIGSTSYTLALDGVSAPYISASAYFTAVENYQSTYYSQSSTAGYEVASGSKAITYTAAQSATLLFTISGIVSASGIGVENYVVTLGGSNLREADVTFVGSTSYKFDLDNTAITTQGISSEWKHDGTTATFLAGFSTAYYELTSNSAVVKYNAETGGTNDVVLTGILSSATLAAPANGVVNLSASAFAGNVEVTNNSGSYAFSLASGSYSNYVFKGTNSADSITNAGNYITILGLSANDTITNTGSNVSLDGGADNDLIKLTDGKNVTVNTSVGNDTIDLTGSNVSEFTVVGFSVGDIIQLSGSVDTITTVTGGIKAGSLTIKGISYVADVDYKWQGGSSLTYLSQGTSGAQLNGTQIEMVSASATWSNEFTITGIGTSAGLSLSTNTVTLYNAALSGATDTIVALTGKDKYSMTLDADVRQAQSLAAAAAFEAGTTTYYSDAYHDYWTATSGTTNSFTYNASVSAAELFKLTGLSEVADSEGKLAGASVGTSVVTLNKTLLDTRTGTTVSIGGGSDSYTLAVSGVSTAAVPSISAAFGTVSKQSASYVQTTKTNDYWTAASGNKSYTYTPETVETATLFTLNGIATVTGSEVADSSTVVTLGRSNLASTNATLTNVKGNYSITLASGAGQSAIKAYFDQTGNTTATYYGEGKTDGYTRTSATLISYNGSVAGASLFTLDGVASTSKTTVDNNAVTVGKADIAAGASKVAVSNTDYTLTLSGVSFSGTTTTLSTGFGTVSGNKATYTQTTATTEYWNKDNEQTYTFQEAVTTPSDFFTVSGVTKVANSLVSGTTLTLGRSNLASTNATLTNNKGYNYQMTLASGAGQSAIKAYFDQTGNTTATYYGEGKTDGYTRTNATLISYTESVAGASLFALDGVASTSKTTVDGNAVTVGKADIAAGASKVALSNTDYTLTLTGVSTVGTTTTLSSGFGSVSDKKATYSQTTATTEFWTATNDQTYTLTAADTTTSDLFTVSGITSIADTLVSGTTLTLGRSNLTTTKATLTDTAGKGYQMTLASGAAQETTPAYFGDVSDNKATYYGEGKTDGYTRTSATLISYNAAVAGDSLFELSGVSSTDNTEVNNKAVTVAKANIAAGASKVAVSNTDYTLTLTGVSTVGTTTTLSSGFGSVSGKKATYSQTTATTEFWTATDKQTYDLTAADTTTSDLFTVSGVTKVANSLVSGTTLTLGRSNLASTKATLTDTAGKGYKLALASGAAQETTPAYFDQTGASTATYYGEGKTDGYTRTNATLISYTESVAGASLFALDGVASTSKTTVDGNAVTVGKADIAAGASKVAVSNTDYTLTLTGVSTVGTTTTLSSGFGSVSGKKATYSQTTATTEFWTATDKQTYDLTAADTTTSDLFTVSGVTKVANSLVSGTTLTLGRSNLASTKATLTNTAGKGYKLALASGAAQSVLSAGFDGNVYKTSGKTDGYTLGNNATVISYVKASGSENLFSVSGVATTNVTYSTSGITATGAATSAQLSMASALNDSLLLIDGFASISGFNATNHSIDGTPTDTTVDGGALVVTTADAPITISGASTATISMVDGDKSYTAEATRLTDITDADAKSVTLTGGFTNTSYGLHLTYASGVTNLDASKAGSTKLQINGAKITRDVSVTGAANVRNSIIGGSGNDTIIGGSKNDSFKGNAGADLFVQSAGRDTIFDYSAADGDVISLQSALTSIKAGTANVTLGTGSDSIIIKNGVGQVLTTKVDNEENQYLFLPSAPTNSSVNGSDLVVTAGDTDYTLAGAAADTVTLTVGDKTYTAEATRITDITDADAKSVTLSTDFVNTIYSMHLSYGQNVTNVDGTQASSSKLNVNGGKVTYDVSLTGAAAVKNTLTGGSGNDTLVGGVKNDVLRGNAGADVFVQSTGSRDTIADYSAADGDIISLQSAVTSVKAGNVDVVLATEAGSILVKKGVGQVITTKLGDEEEHYLYLNSAPTNSSVNGNDLVVTAGGTDYTLAGAAADTVTLTVGDRTYTAEATRITDITDADAKSVTLSTDFVSSVYSMHLSYGQGVTNLDGTQASSTKLNVNGGKVTYDVSLTGAAAVKNTLTGGSGNDTIIGGAKADVLRGNEGADVFIQSAGSRDTIADYTAGEDVISLQSALTNVKAGKVDVVLTTADGAILVKKGTGQAITTKVGDEVSTSVYLADAPTNASVSGDDLVIAASGLNYTLAGAAADTVTVTVGDRTYTAEATRITDITDADAKSVTLTTDFTNTTYSMHLSYGQGVTNLNGTNASSSKLNVNGGKVTYDVSLTGAAAVKNTLTGGSGNDTLIGGVKNDVLRGNEGADLFVQSTGSRDTIADYSAADGDIISLQSAITSVKAGNVDVVLTTADGAILVKKGTGQVITTKLGDEEEQYLYLNSAPTNASVSGDDLVVTAGGKDVTLAGAAADTVTLTVGDKTYAVEATRITDITDADAKSVTLTSDFTNTVYSMHLSYGKDVTKLNGTNAGSSKLNVNGGKVTYDVSLTGAANAKNTLTGGSGNDTIIGGAKADVLRGNEGEDLFVQSAGSRDTISDYTAGEDVIMLQSELTNVKAGNTDLVLTTADGAILVKKGTGQAITTKVGRNGEESTSIYLSSAPTNTTVRSGNLVVSTDKANYTLGAANDTVTIIADNRTYEASKTRITDITDADAKGVTLASGFNSSAYTFDTTTTVLDASNATKALRINAAKATAAVSVKGSESAQNSITGSAYDDTIVGGTGNDSLRGGNGNDLFVQTAGTDTIVDYTEGDTIQLLSKPTKTGKLYSKSYQFVTAEGTVIVNNGYGKTITTVVGGSADVATTNDELWGVSGEKDTFLFDGGKDTVHNYEEDDVISLADYSLTDLINGAPSISDKNLVFTFDKSNSLTITDVAGKGTPVTFDDGTTYTLNGKTYTKK